MNDLGFNKGACSTGCGGLRGAASKCLLMKTSEAADIVKGLNQVMDVAHSMVQPLKAAIMARRISDRGEACQVVTLHKQAMSFRSVV